MKLRYFYKYYYIINKLKLLKENNNKIKKDSKQIIIIRYNKQKGKRNDIKRERNIASEDMKYNTQIFPINNIYSNINYFNSFPAKIMNNNSQNKIIKIKKSTNIIKNYNNSEFLSNAMEEKNKIKNSFLYSFKNKKKINKTNSPKNNSFNYNTKSNILNNNYKDNIAEKNNNLIINYINEMDKFNRMIMKQKSSILISNNKNITNSSNKKYSKKLYTHRKTNSCINAPLLNKVSEINTNLYSFSSYNNKIKKCNTEENKLFVKNKAYISIESHSNSKKKKNSIISKNKRNKIVLLKKDFSKNNEDNNNYSNNSNNINNNILNQINANIFKRIKKTSYTFKKEKNFYYQNNSLNYFKTNSFLSTNLFSAKNNANYSNHKSNNSNNNIFSPVLLNRINSHKLKKIPNSNSSHFKINSNIINTKNKNIIKKNKLDFNNSLSTTYKDKQTTKDANESGTNIYMKYNTSRNCNIEKSKTSFNQNKNNLFNTNQKNNLNTNKITNYLQKNNSSINYINKEIAKESNDKTNIIINYNNPISSTKKANKILQNISFSNNSSDKPINDNNFQNFNNLNKNSSNNNYFNYNKKFKNYNNIRISSLFSILKEDKKNSKKKEENKPKDYSCINIINECFENKNNKNIEKNENNNKNEKLETSFESLSDSKMYELAKTFISKDECLDKHAMDQILKNKKLYNK